MKQKEEKQQQQRQLLKDPQPQAQKLSLFPVSLLDDGDFRSDGIIQLTCWPKFKTQLKIKIKNNTKKKITMSYN